MTSLSALRRPPAGLTRILNHHAQSTVRRSSTAAATSGAMGSKPLTSILIANRGEIALRVNRTAAAYGIRTTTIYTDPDARSQHALSSPYSVNLGDPSAYLDGDRIIAVAKQQGCNGIHPGYGFLSENPAFARKCQDAGLTFIGPPWEAIEAMGSKSTSKDIMNAAGVPCIPGYHGANQDPDVLQAEAEKIGYPVLLKAVKGGGGKGMRIARTAAEFPAQLESAKREARNAFGDEVMLVEKYITTPRHIEVQVFADRHGNCVALGERDCSVQRRHQKILEESPAPHLPEEVRQDLWDKARKAALAVGYEGAGTVEFIFDNETGEFFFMEMNTRLQVEHPVTEMVTGEDLVHWQLIVAEGGTLPLSQEEVQQRIAERGWAIEARIYAENPDMDFLPDSGTLLHLRTPPATETVRIDAGFAAGDAVSSYYDPMIAKLIVRGSDRRGALRTLRAALEAYEIAGPVTNIEFLKRMCVSPDFVAGAVETGYIAKHREELFARLPTPPEVLAQAAIGVLLREAEALPVSAFGAAGSAIGFGGSGYQQRDIDLVELAADGTAEPTPTRVSIRQLAPGRFDISVNGETTYRDVTSTLDPTSHIVTSFYPHTRLASTLIQDEDRLTLFQHGRQHRLRVAAPAWAEEVLGGGGGPDVAHSVRAPMPCRVLRVEVREGERVRRDQPLVVIESMKMETVIRAPVDGVVERVVHRAGDLCKAGTALVEFVGENQ